MHPLDVLDNVLATKGPGGVLRPLHAEAARESIASMVEFAAVRWSWWTAHAEDLLQVLPNGGETWSGFCPPQDGLLGDVHHPQGEVHEIPGSPEGWNAGEPFMMFQEGFKTRLVQAGLDTRFAHSILGALNEMASNAVEHAAAPVAPVAAYQITDDCWAFSVTDVGCGVLQSLRRNPMYANVSDDVSAVRLAVRDGVSGTGQSSRGYGFTSVFKALVNRMCAIRFRSSGAGATWVGTSPAAQHLSLTPSPSRVGFHVQVEASF